MRACCRLSTNKEYTHRKLGPAPPRMASKQTMHADWARSIHEGLGSMHATTRTAFECPDTTPLTLTQTMNLHCLSAGLMDHTHVVARMTTREVMHSQADVVGTTGKPWWEFC